MNEQQWEQLDARLDQAIDSLNSEQPPLILMSDDPALIDLIDTVRLARTLREPSPPGDEFAFELADFLEASLRNPMPPDDHSSDVGADRWRIRP